MQVLQTRQGCPQVCVDDPELHELAPMSISQSTSDSARRDQSELHHSAHLATEQGLNRRCSLNTAGDVICGLEKFTRRLEFPSQH